MREINLSDIITRENVKYMGEMMAVTAIRTFLKHSAGPYCESLYKGLIKDIIRTTASEYRFSDGYDFAQTAICFLCEYYGKTLNDVLVINKNGKDITLKKMCLRIVGKEISHKLKYSFRALDIDEITLMPTIIEEVEDYESSDLKVKKIIEKLDLTPQQENALICRIDGHSYPEAAKLLSSNITNIWRRIKEVRMKYINMYAQP